MIRGIYTAASGMIATLMANDTLANNMANLNTVGFKNNSVTFQSFPEMLITKMSAAGNREVGTVMTGSKVRETRIHFDQGDLYETGNTFDLALKGDGFFTVQNEAGDTCYTRAGTFSVNDEGFLTTIHGDYVMGELGKIQLNLDEAPFFIDQQGEIMANGRLVETLKITRFQDNQALQKVGHTMFEKGPLAVELPPPGPNEPPGYTVEQGKLERSNSNAIGELVRSIAGMRLYESLQKNVKMHNQALGKAVNEVGRYR